MDEEKPKTPGPDEDPEMSRKTAIKEDPEVHKESHVTEDPEAHRVTHATEDPEMETETVHREGPVAGEDPGSIEFEVESVDEDDETAVSQRAGHVIRVAPSPGPDSGSDGSRYEFRDEIGSGGMAVVNAAHDRQLSRTVAVKRLRLELSSSAKSRQRFFDEALVIAGLDHPGVVPIFEKGTLPEGDLFYSMKKVSGQTLENLISRRAPDEINRREGVARFIDTFERICQTMAAAHQAGIVHRDLKPANVMVDDFGSVFVMDWGLAKRIGDDSLGDSKKTVAGALLGTPSYMSPEQAKGEAHRSDCRSDVFSLGVMLYEILTGTNPFDKDSIKASLDVVVHYEPDSPRSLNRAVDRDLAAICLKAMAKDPVKRYVSARELADDVRRYREFRQVSARAPGLVDRIGRWWRRNPRLGGAVAALLVTALIVGGGMLSRASSERKAVAGGYERIDEAQLEIKRVEGEMETLESRLISEDLTVGEREAIRRQHYELSVLRDFQLDLEESMALAITGFTVFSPDERAQSILRERGLGRVEDALEKQEWFLARVEIEAMLKGAKRYNILGFDSDDIAWLGEKLAEAKLGQRSESNEDEVPDPSEVDRETPGTSS